MYLHVVA